MSPVWLAAGRDSDLAMAGEITSGVASAFRRSPLAKGAYDDTGWVTWTVITSVP